MKLLFQHLKSLEASAVFTVTLIATFTNKIMPLEKYEPSVI